MPDSLKSSLMESVSIGLAIRAFPQFSKGRCLHDLEALEQVATIFHIVEVTQASGTQQYLVFQPYISTHRYLPLRLHAQEHHHRFPVLFPNLKVLRLFLLGLWQFYAESCCIILGLVLNNLAARRPMNSSLP